MVRWRDYRALTLRLSSVFVTIFASGEKSHGEFGLPLTFTGFGLIRSSRTHASKCVLLNPSRCAVTAAEQYILRLLLIVLDKRNTGNGRIANMKRDANGLRDFLFDALDDLKDGRLASEDAMATAKIAEVIIKSVEIEIKHRKLLLDGKKDIGNLEFGSLVLGSEKPEVLGEIDPRPRTIKGKSASGSN